MLLPFAVIGVPAAALAVALQHFFLFRSPACALTATGIIAAGSYFLIRSSLRSLSSSMRFSVGLVSGGPSFFYKEVDG